MGTRSEHDSFAPIKVPAERLWGAQTQRSLENFRISGARAAKALARATKLPFVSAPCKVNPTQSEALTMACAQGKGNDVAVNIGGAIRCVGPARVDDRAGRRRLQAKNGQGR